MPPSVVLLPEARADREARAAGEGGRAAGRAVGAAGCPPFWACGGSPLFPSLPSLSSVGVGAQAPGGYFL